VRGFAVCRSRSSWGGPASVRIGGGSFGAQLGVESTDVVILVMNQRGMDRLTGDKFTIGADASAAIGPVGRTATAQTDAKVTAEMLSYSRAKGAFAGVALDGASITPDRAEDKKLYGRDVNNAEIIRGQVYISVDPAGDRLVGLGLSPTGVPRAAEGRTRLLNRDPVLKLIVEMGKTPGAGQVSGNLRKGGAGRESSWRHSAS
jgi:lipid-binding SYLF domain-containing protein